MSFNNRKQTANLHQENKLNALSSSASIALLRPLNYAIIMPTFEKADMHLKKYVTERNKPDVLTTTARRTYRGLSHHLSQYRIT